MIRILHVFGALNRGGAETMIMNLYRQIDRTKIQFDFVVHTQEVGDYEKEIGELGGKVFRVPRYNIKNHLEYTHAWQEFFKAHPEYKLLHGHLRGSAFQYLKVAKQNGLKTIMHSHSISSRGEGIEKHIKNLLRFPMRKWVDYPYACSTEAGIWLFGKNIVKNKKFKIIKNGIDIEKYEYSKIKRESLRKKLGLKEEKIIGHVGSFTYPKNHKFLLEIFNEVQKQRDDVKLLLVGDGELREEITDQIKRQNLEEKIILAGLVENVQDYLQVMDVFLFPSHFEGLPVSVVEAQATGLKCFLSDRITQEVDLDCDLIDWNSLEKSSKEWSEEILNNLDYERYSRNENIEKAGYDVRVNAIELEENYNIISNEGVIL